MKNYPGRGNRIDGTDLAIKEGRWRKTKTGEDVGPGNPASKATKRQTRRHNKREE